MRPAAPGPERPGHGRPESSPRWAPTRALGRAVLLTGLLLVAAVLSGRVDLVVLAVPFAVGTAVSLRRRPAVAPEVRLTVDDARLVEGGPIRATVGVGNPDEVDYHLAVVRTLVSPWLRVDAIDLGGGRDSGEAGAAGPLRPPADRARWARGGDRPFAVSVPPGSAIDVELRGEVLRWGRHPIGPAAVQVIACDGLVAGRSVLSGARSVPGYPMTAPFHADDAMPRAAGLVGAHRSRRPGDGGELAGVRVFTPGDRLRRIDWRVSLRARQLHVAATLSERDAEVVLLLDLLAEAGRSGGVTGPASVLDTTVRAAAAIGEHYLHRGDRIAMLEYGGAGRRLRPGAGRRHYLTLLEWLLDVRVASFPDGPDERIFGPHLLPANALVVVLTPLIKARSAGMLARLARSGRFVVAVDTLPNAAAPPSDGRWADLAYRLWRLERDNTIGQLREHGVPVVAWGGAGSLDQVLRDVARLASAPKPVYR